MTDNQITERLLGCFEQIFPGLDRSDLINTSQSSNGTWDSIAHVTLMSLVTEEFAVDLDFEEFERLDSFEAVRNAIAKHTAAGQ